MVDFDSRECGKGSGGGIGTCSTCSEVEEDEADSGKFALGSETAAASRDVRSTMAASHKGRDDEREISIVVRVGAVRGDN